VGSILQQAQREWRLFAHDQPGHRFVNHYRRSQDDRSLGKRAVRMVIGVVLFAAGIMMLFTPGPGWLLVIFGLGMFATESCRLARLLDRTEATLRAWARPLQHWWRTSSAVGKAVAVVAALAVVGLGSAAAWKVWT
jgi:uncharacterized protein (TIGR02611 family)